MFPKMLMLLLSLLIHQAGAAAAHSTSTETIVLAGGCFWGVEAVFEHVKGVREVVSGYAGGTAESATYEKVSSGATKHAEAVKITYDPTQVTLDQLLDVYFTVAHNPTELNRQGPDVGAHYRSAVFYASAEQKKAVEAKKLTYKRAAEMVTTLEPLNTFYLAEEYHQNFAARNPSHPYIVAHDAPKVVALQKQFPTLYKQQ